MKTYKKLREEQQKKYNDFSNKYMFYAFSNEQFENGMRKLGLDPNEDYNKIYRTCAGGFVLKEKDDELHKLIDEFDTELKLAMEDEDFLTDAFEYELANHEYCITYDYEPTLDALGLTMEDVLNNRSMKRALHNAERKYLQGVD